MAVATGLICVEKKYSYQHIQGVMLVNLNKLAFELNLSHSAYRVAGFLISNYNVNSNCAFPAMGIIANSCKMSRSTVIKNLEILVKTGLLISLKEPGRQTKYYFSKKLTGEKTSTPCKTNASTACKTAHDNKPIKLITDFDLSYDIFNILLSINHFHNGYLGLNLSKQQE